MDDAALERYARLFHERGRLTVNAEREKPFAVEDWEGRTPEQKEIDLRGASAVVAAVVHDAGLENTRSDAQLYAVRAHLPAILDALAGRIADERWESRKTRFRDAKAAMAALEGGEPQDRADEKGSS
jgi:hypothetical protein